ncbi:hypothetical protein V5799_020060 [Amblyomma americanum]|uniref:Uncharacterized protein n=1 Tax=Amblyomma americanum TaxID=6943 RepID=A0AAQ4EVI2_AMBAM
MLRTIYKSTHRKSVFVVLIFGVLLYLYHIDYQPVPSQLRRRLMDRLIVRDGNCMGMRVINECGKQQYVKVLFVVDTALENGYNRLFARNSYAERSFAPPINWFTMFRMVGNVTDQKKELVAMARSECRAFGNIVVPRNGRTGEIFKLGRNNNTSSFLQFAPWILANCPNVYLVVFMQHNVLSYPFYLPNYRVVHIDHRPEVIHCHGLGDFLSSLCHARSVVMANKPGVELFA